jgi:ATP-dependent RNA helicase DDX31/DBP7
MALKGKLEWLVLDEADRLLDMGLGGQVEQIVQHVRANQPKSGPKRDGVTWNSILACRRQSRLV